MLYVFTDGNCKNNGKSNAVAGYAVFFACNKESPFYTFNTCGILTSPSPTNQQAELTALLTLFTILSDNYTVFKGIPITVCCDSMYSIQCITKWYTSWMLNGWKNTKRQPVKNSALLQTILQKKTECESQGIIMSFKHVFSHTARPTNTNSIEYILWNGNFEVDNMINDLLSQCTQCNK